MITSVSFVILIPQHLAVPEQGNRGTMSGTPIVRTDVEEKAAHGFGSLKSLLDAISVIYTGHDVRSRLST